MSLNGIVPRIDMPFGAAVVYHVAGRGEEYTAEMNQLAEREIDQQQADTE